MKNVKFEETLDASVGIVPIYVNETGV